MEYLKDSELILNPDGSIYHLNLLPEDIGDIILTVGDPKRVEMVSRHFDEIEVKKSKREFITHTGRLGRKRISVISTGIGPDNIDIVINELDALANIDLHHRVPRDKHRALSIIRLGTSGSLQADIGVDEVVVSGWGVGFDNLLFFYTDYPKVFNRELARLVEMALDNQISVYTAQGSEQLFRHFASRFRHGGITITSPGFYGPQGRRLRLSSILTDAHIRELQMLRWNEWRITNFEMETAALFGLSRLLGHQPLACNTILANRATGQFSKDPYRAVERMIVQALEAIDSM